jgi:hypothetical protein
MNSINSNIIDKIRDNVYSNIGAKIGFGIHCSAKFDIHPPLLSNLNSTIWRLHLGDGIKGNIMGNMDNIDTIVATNIGENIAENIKINYEKN